LDAAADLRAAGLRVTRPRLAVLAALRGNPHASVETVSATVRAEIGSVSLQAVYDVLRVLGAAGLVRRIDLAGTPSRYELRVGDNHHHLVCRRCSTVVDVDCAVGAAPCLTPSPSEAGADFAVDEAEVIFWGLCADCRAAVATGSDGDAATALLTPARTTTER
jgi:Fur family ferric uptake transcriptional regulator